MKASKPTNDGDQRFLGGVLGVGVVASQAPTHCVDLIVVMPQQTFKSVPVACLGGIDQCDVFEVVANRTRPYGAATW